MSIFNSEFLAKSLRRGDEKAFENLFKECFPRLCRFASIYIIDDSIAKDIVQGVFIKLWETKQNLREENSILAYLLSITKNSCLDYLKHKQIENKYQKQAIRQQTELELNYYALARLELDLYDYNDINKIIEKTISSLPAQCQQVFKMSRYENLSNAEIAEKLGIGIKAVEANITRALKIFRHELKDYLAILILLSIPIN